MSAEPRRTICAGFSPGPGSMQNDDLPD
jgi:hypothetical protein